MKTRRVSVKDGITTIRGIKTQVQPVSIEQTKKPVPPGIGRINIHTTGQNSNFGKKNLTDATVH